MKLQGIFLILQAFSVTPNKINTAPKTPLSVDIINYIPFLESHKILIEFDTLVIYHGHKLFNSFSSPNYQLGKQVYANWFKPLMITSENSPISVNVTFIQKFRKSSNLIISNIPNETNSTLHNFLQRFISIINSHTLSNGFIHKSKDLFLFPVQNPQLVKPILFSQLKTYLKFKATLYLHGTEQKDEIVIKLSTINPYVPTTQGQLVPLIVLKCKQSIFQCAEITSNYRISFDFTRNFFGYPLKMAISRLYKPVYEVEVTSTEVKPKRGFFKDFSETIFERLNFTTNKFLCSGHGKYPAGTVTGTLLNGTWIGCMGDVISGRAEISVAAPDQNRYGHVQFLPRFEYVSIAFSTRTPKVIISWKAIYKAFNPKTWLLSGISTLFLSIVLWLGNKVVYMEYKKRINLGQVVFKMFSLALSQGVAIKESIGIGGYISFIIWLQCSWILATAYTSKLTALLTIPVPENTIPETFGALEASSSFSWGAPKLFRYGIGGEIFKSSRSPMMQSLNSKMKQDEDGISCLIRAERQNYACISWNFLLDFDKFVEFDEELGKKKFANSMEIINFIPLTQIVAKRSIIEASLAYFVENVYEMGLTKKWADLDKMKLRLERRAMKKKEEMENRSKDNKSLANKTRCNENKPESLKLVNFQGSFGLLTVGLSNSVLIFLGELGTVRFFRLNIIY